MRNTKNIKVINIDSEKPGKTSLILGGVHGNEKCGVEAMNQLSKEVNVIAGRVIFIYANLKAIKLNRRFIEFNLNRCFMKNLPKRIKDSLEGRTAKEIMCYMDQADSLLDIHASNTKNSKSFVICDKKNNEKAKIFDSEIVVNNFDNFEKGSSDYYMNMTKKESFGFECGYILDKKSLNRAKKAIINFLISNGNISGKIIMKKQKILKLFRLYKNNMGKFRMSRYFKDFEKIKKRTLIGYDGKKEVYAKNGEIILFVRNRDNLREECFLVLKDSLFKKI